VNHYEPVTVGELGHVGPRPGVAAVRDAVLFLERARGVRDMGVYSRRRVHGSSVWSLHAVGRAWDAGVRDRATGQRVAERFMHLAGKLGVCEVIWQRNRWTPEKGWRNYTGIPHLDHVHIGFTVGFADSPAPPDLARKLCTLVWANG